MANIYNYGLVGTSNDVQLGKGGLRIINAGGTTLSVRNSLNNAYVALTAGNITSGTGFTFTGDGANLTNIPNGGLQHSSITIGSSSVSLGDTLSTITGLTSISATTFTGALTGNASGTAANVTGIVALANGGTNANLTAINGGIVYSTASAFAITAAGTAGDVYMSGGAGAPTWSTPASANTVSKLVIRDSNGNFSAGTITVAGDGTHSGLTLNGTVTQATDATTKAYVDAVASSLAIHNAVDAASTGLLTATYANGTGGVGSTLTGPSATFILDTFTAPVNSRILIKDQHGIETIGSITPGSGYADSSYVAVPLTGGSGTGATADITVASGAVTVVTIVSVGTGYGNGDVLSASNTNLGGTGAGFSVPVTSSKDVQNGIYVVTNDGSAAPWVLTRASDFDNSPDTELHAGVFVFVTNGSVNKSTGWVETAIGTGTNKSLIVGTNAVDWTQFSGSGAYLGGTGIAISGNTINAKVDNTTVYFDGSNNIAVKSSGTSGQSLLSAGTGSAGWGALSLSTPAAITGTLPVGNGGTGATTFVANSLLIGNTTSAISSSTALTFTTGTNDVLTVGGATGMTVTTVAAGGDVTLTALNTNANIVLAPNGSGVIVQSGVTAAAYAAAVVAGAATAIPNKQYVLDTVTSGAAQGSIKAFQAVVPLNANTGGSPINIGGVAMPAGATVLSVKVVVSVADTAATLTIGKAGSVAAYMDSSENNAQVVGMYVAETFVTESTSIQLIATVTNTAATSGSTCIVIVMYQVAQ